ncbi:hypothetical protein Ava_B0316 (plasmid) [Trichormus variabilis ATCC 29413]|uniref:Uncharacterized protein n=2 Tax=Anabaena variabilis TaxID=264691 RepID=Q3M1W0_TRIV2|nr:MULTISPECIES: hypothetical protein [Nostocaceae]ABA25026.1 hypothetical protein Ava_B0316 [Trichormus variabilis ATCC 29413]MBC1217853.1 hypothetical protein [Trichormus variabilis ARAD]MBC1259157.1 hypothetical protein [Trichormus variabilis V5]MBC1270687.1 hypothetical protein [Trichormus variabilis FSR]MBC1305513.1 hypothetical protein [Trichormus variabilis N2B]
MTDDSHRNSAVNAAATTKIQHAQLQDLSLSAARRMYKGGIRAGEPIRTRLEAQQMLEKIPPSGRAGVDGKSAASNVEQYLSDKHASHIKPHSKGGSNNPNNIKWENAKDNIARGDKTMTWQEKVRLDAKWHFDNLTGAIKAGFQAAPMGAAVGAMTSLPFSLLTNGLRVVRGEISAQEAATTTLKDTVMGGAVGGATAFATATVAAACPPIAIALTTVAPVLAVVGATGMIHQFFKILDEHKQDVRVYYESLTQQELEYLQAVENELIYEHKKNLEFLSQAEAINQEIINRPTLPGIEGAMQRLRESVAIAQSLGMTSADSKLLANSQPLELPPHL